MRRASVIIAMLFAAMLLTIGCGKETGTEGGTCFDDGKCKEGLRCYSSVCVNVPKPDSGGRLVAPVPGDTNSADAGAFDFLPSFPDFSPQADLFIAAPDLFVATPDLTLADSAGPLPPGTPQKDFGRVCNPRSSGSCPSPLRCISLAGWPLGFCSVRCAGSSDATRCPASRPTTMNRSTIAACVISIGSPPTESRCAFLCFVPASGGTPARSGPCPTGLACTHTDARSGIKVCKPGSSADGGAG